jgi:hypothetical protein
LKSKEILKQRSIPSVQSFYREAYGTAVKHILEVCYVFKISFQGKLFTVKCLDDYVANNYSINKPKSLVLEQKILPACEQYLKKIEPENIVELNLVCISISYEENKKYF